MVDEEPVKEEVKMTEKPPKFDCSYGLWMLKLESWTHTTGIDKKKHGHLIILHSLSPSLQEEVYENVEKASLLLDDGGKKVTDFLDTKFKVADDIQMYRGFESFIEYKREEESMTEYLAKFEGKVAKLKTLGLVLPDPVLAYTVLKNSCLKTDALQTIRAAAENMKFGSLKASIERIYSSAYGTERAQSSRFDETVHIKYAPKRFPKVDLCCS